ncbi:MAG: substrate-binding domain-containing protein [Botrimarina sp.]
MAVAIGLARVASDRADFGPRKKPLVVYCAAGLRTAVEQVLARYEADRGETTALQLGPSGALEAQIRLSGKGDLYLPAAAEPFLSRLQSDGLVGDVLPIARMRLVLAYSPRVAERPRSISELLDSSLDVGVCNVQAAAGLKTKEALAAVGLWDRLERSATASLPTVTELAEAVRDGGRLEAGIVWDTTARQFGLPLVEPPELAEAHAIVGVGVLSSSSDPSAAQRLARYLAAPDGGRPMFAEHGFAGLRPRREEATPARASLHPTGLNPTGLNPPGLKPSTGPAPGS